MTIFASPERVPVSAVERLLVNFAALCEGLNAAIVNVDAGPERARAERAASLLAQEYAAVEVEAKAFRDGFREGLLQHATELRLLARRMNGFSFAFAGDGAALLLATQRQHLVLTAWQISAAANRSEAAGL